MDPETVEYIKKLFSEFTVAEGPIQEVIKNIMDERISAEEQECLQKPLLPQKYLPKPPPRQRRSRKKQELLSRFDPFPPQNIRTVTDYQNEILYLYDEAEHEGGRRDQRMPFHLMEIHQRSGKRSRKQLHDKNS